MVICVYVSNLSGQVQYMFMIFIAKPRKLAQMNQEIVIVYGNYCIIDVLYNSTTTLDLHPHPPLRLGSY